MKQGLTMFYSYRLHVEHHGHYAAIIVCMRTPSIHNSFIQRVSGGLLALLFALCLAALPGCDDSSGTNSSSTNNTSQEQSESQNYGGSESSSVNDEDASSSSELGESDNSTPENPENKLESTLEEKGSSTSQKDATQSKKSESTSGETKSLRAYFDVKNGYEVYSKLDNLGRCGKAIAKLGPETVPARGEKRDNSDVQRVYPSGWKQAFYQDLIKASNGALYNRCHLIAWSLAGENGNERNLITGTRHMNEEMTTYEQKVKNYINNTGNHVVYRVTPHFKGNELVARGVRLEALSVEDNGSGIKFNVYLQNIQDGVKIDYLTGENKRTKDGSKGSSAAVTNNSSSRSTGNSSSKSSAKSNKQKYILNTNSMKFHYPSCSAVSHMADKNKRPITDTRASIIDKGYSPCGICFP